MRPSEEYAQTQFTLEAGDRLLVYTLDMVLGWPENGNTRAQADDITVVVIDIGNMPEQTP